MYSQMIIVKPSMENSSLILSEDIFPVLHRLFVSNGCRFGLSFPAYSYEKCGILGNIIEVLCNSKDELEGLDLHNRFKGNEGIRVLKDINQTDDYVLFCRIREKNRFETYVKRFMMRGNEDPGDMKSYIQHHNKNVFAHAYITVKSNSTGQKYNIFVAPTEERAGKFNSFGLVIRQPSDST